MLSRDSDNGSCVVQSSYQITTAITQPLGGVEANIVCEPEDEGVFAVDTSPAVCDRLQNTHFSRLAHNSPWGEGRGGGVGEGVVEEIRDPEGHVAAQAKTDGMSEWPLCGQQLGL